MSQNIILSDELMQHDKISTGGIWAKTQVLVGYGLYKDNLGISQLNETVFDGHNMVPIGGVQYAMEKIFGVKGPLSIPYLNDTHQIGAQNSTLVGSNGMPYPYGHSVCLFGVGTGGAAENNSTTLDVTYNDTCIPGIVPIRYTNQSLGDSEVNKYYGKKTVDGITGYYLKRFDQDPEIRHLWKDGEEDTDGTEVTSSVFTSSSEIGIESFTEMVLSISKKDVREWFAANGNIEEPRINTLALFNAVYDADKKDYAMIRMMSRLNIPTEPLSLSKDLCIIYRVFGS